MIVWGREELFYYHYSNFLWHILFHIFSYSFFLQVWPINESKKSGLFLTGESSSSIAFCNSFLSSRLAQQKGIWQRPLQKAHFTGEQIFWNYLEHIGTDIFDTFDIFDRYLFSPPDSLNIKVFGSPTSEPTLFRRANNLEYFGTDILYIWQKSFLSSRLTQQVFGSPTSEDTLYGGKVWIRYIWYFWQIYLIYLTYLIDLEDKIFPFNCFLVSITFNFTFTCSMCSISQDDFPLITLLTSVQSAKYFVTFHFHFGFSFTF